MSDIKTKEMICQVCNKNFISELRKTWSGKEFFPNICSDECRKKYQEEEEKKINEEEKKRRREYMIEKAENEIIEKIPKRYLNIDTDKQDLLKEVIGKSLFITGPVGCGKTVFIASIAKLMIRNFNQVKFLSFPRYISHIQGLFNDDYNGGKNGYSNTPQDAVNKTAGFSGTLFLDDIAAEKTTEFVRGVIFRIIDQREQEELPIVITSNLSLSQISSVIDPRVSSRIAGICRVLQFKGSDRRLKKE